MDSDRQAEFYTRLTAEILSGMSHSYGGENWDTDRFGVCPDDIPGILFRSLNRSFSLLGRHVSLVRTTDLHNRFAAILPFLPDFSRTYLLLEDDYSRSLLVRLVAFRMLGYRHIRLPAAGDFGEYSRLKKTARDLVLKDTEELLTPQNVVLDLFDLRTAGFPIRCYSNLNLILPIFLLKQYEYRHDAVLIAPRTGDYIIDAGGGWGDSALFFARAAGPEGRVFSFEFAPENLAVLEKNIRLNPNLAGHIEVVCRALWERTGDMLHYAARGMATSILPPSGGSPGPDSLGVLTQTIDDFVGERKPGKIDFIKMDLEGAELKALQGAARTIREYRPSLAIALYHSLQDFSGFPPEIHRLCPEYAFFLDHFTLHDEETILFAVPREKLALRPDTSAG